MKIKCDNPGTRAITYKGERVKFDEKGIGTIDDVAGQDLIASNPHFTKVKTNKKEMNDA